jgi:hypothetical protein
MALNVIYPASDLPENVDSYLKGLYSDHTTNIAPSAHPKRGSMLSGVGAIYAVLIFALISGRSAIGL